VRGAQCVWLRTNDPAVCVVTSGVCCYQRCVLLPAVCVVTSGVCCYQRRVLRSSARHPVRIEALGRPKSDGTLARPALCLRQCVWLRTHDPASVCWYGPTIRAQCVLLWTHDPARGTQCEMKHWERQSPTVSMAASLVPEAVCMARRVKTSHGYEVWVVTGPNQQGYGHGHNSNERRHALTSCFTLRQSANTRTHNRTRAAPAGR